MKVTPMNIRLQHTTTYTYDREIHLEPHIIRLRPRCDPWQNVNRFRLTVEPEPKGHCEFVDLEGNVVTQIWFKEPTDRLHIEVEAEVQTPKQNPFDFLITREDMLPVDYGRAANRLQAYLHAPHPDTGLFALAEETAAVSNGDVVSFLNILNQRLYNEIAYTERPQGDPLPPEVTWNSRCGACRDMAILFINICRAAGLAARFVSGYQRGDIHANNEHQLHAWAEVYVPNGGWRGFDPTSGLAVANEHIACAAGPTARCAAPVSGAIRGNGVYSELEFKIQITAD